ncbi:MAG: hypothetical protein GY874_16290 [Desulfobacteraceae bacterium]|nr:hypothetical protein [Desulfobacteraceae bacterium]
MRKYFFICIVLSVFTVFAVVANSFAADNYQSTINTDGFNDFLSTVLDDDDIAYDIDNCPHVSNNDQADFDEDGIGDACDDSDGDGTVDALDDCPLVASDDPVNDKVCDNDVNFNIIKIYSAINDGSSELQIKSPQINANNHVVWELEDVDDEYSEIYYYDGVTASNISNTNTSNIFNQDPKINANNRVVWTSYDDNNDRVSEDSYQIYYYNGSNIVFSADGSGAQINDNDQVVWRCPVGFDFGEILYYDGSDPLNTDYINISNNSSRSDITPQINNNNSVVWASYDDSDYEIYYYDGSNPVIISESTNCSSEYQCDFERPKINDNEHVVWAWDTTNLSPYRFSAYHVYYYNKIDPVLISEDTMPYEYLGFDLQINNENHVVWASSDGSDSEIYYYDGSNLDYYDGSNLVIISEDTDGADVNPQINDENHVVWESVKDSDSEIYYYNGSDSLNISNNSNRNDQDPQINANGFVVWHSDTDIYLAYLDSDSDSIADVNDNCPEACNAGQGDFNEDGVGDACDDSDGDGTVDALDNCPLVASDDPENDKVCDNDVNFNIIKISSDINDGSSEYHLMDPQINDNGYVVWSSSNGSGSEIYYFNGETASNISGSSNSTVYDQIPQINDNNQVVWESFDGSNYEINYFDGSTTSTITSNRSYQTELLPQINDDNYVVWQGSGEIYYFDGDEESDPLNISNNSNGNERYPQINANNHVVWESDNDSSDNGSDDEIYYFGGNEESDPLNISNNPNGDDNHPQINANNHVVWQHDNDSDVEIYYFDGSDSLNISNNPNGNDEDPQINDNEHVAWSGYDGSDYEIYYYGGSTTTPTIISENTNGSDYHPQINDNSHVVWESFDGSNYEIYYFNGSDSVNISNNPNVNDVDPQINADGFVVWQSGQDIYLAYLDSDSDTIADVNDNCPYVFNPGQDDSAIDDYGESCFGNDIDDSLDDDDDGDDDDDDDDDDDGKQGKSKSNKQGKNK